MWTCALAHPRCICSLQCLYHCVCLRQILCCCECVEAFFHFTINQLSIPNLDESVVPLCLGLPFMSKKVCVCVGVLLYFITFSPGSERRRSRNLVMPVVYLVAYLLKDLTLELFTQPALGESLTHNINLPPPASSKQHRHFRLEPFRPPPPVGASAYIHIMSGFEKRADESPQSGSVCVSYSTIFEFDSQDGLWDVNKELMAQI